MPPSTGDRVGSETTWRTVTTLFPFPHSLSVKTQHKNLSSLYILHPDEVAIIGKGRKKSKTSKSLKTVVLKSFKIIIN